MDKNSNIKIKIFYWFDLLLITINSLLLIFDYLKIIPSVDLTPFFILFAIIGTAPILVSAIKALINRKVTVDLLASIALIFALVNSEWHSAVFINLMIAFARILGNIVQDRSDKALKSLLKLRPEKAYIKKGDKTIEVDIKKIKIGDLVLVQSGETVPVDGKVVEGKATINQSSLTGESASVFKTVGDQVFSSTVSEEGTLVIRAEKVGKDTTLEQFIRLVDEAQTQKPPIQTIADKFAGWYILVVIIGSLLILMLTGRPELVLTILLVTCADDIAVAVPLAFSASMAKAGKKGMIVKGAGYLEALNKLKILITDKTGTLTYGKPEVKEITIFNKMPQNLFLKYLASAEGNSDHPVARSIVNYAKSKKVNIVNTRKVQEFIGRGIKVEIGGKRVIAGRHNFLTERGIDISKLNHDKIHAAEKDGYMIVALGINGKIVGFVAMQDKIREEALPFFKKLPGYGVNETVILTGDNEVVAKKVAQRLKATHFYANLLPAQKLDHIKRLLSKKYKVAMIGDGVNDAAALSLADIGIAMGTIGTDAAIESADIAIMDDKLIKVIQLLKIAKKTNRVVVQNFVIWGVVNGIGLALTFAGILKPESAAAFNFITDFFPILNSFRLFR
ncbi:MAG: cation-translocating P-type ATPase [Patescibacteria group bacterium]|nr:cation-translocating P-type ATPase [Patescibacteria group bacterium]